MGKSFCVLLPQPIEKQAAGLLENAGVDLVCAKDSAPETVCPLLKDAHGIVLRTGIAVTGGLLDRAENLMVVSRTGGGLDNVDVGAATEKGVIVTSNLGVNTQSVVEHALALMLALSKRLFAMDKAVRTGEFRIRYQNLPHDLHGKTLGLLGFGRIGAEMARCCGALFHMRVISHDPYVSEAVKNAHEGRVAFVGEKELFARADVLSIHVPLTDETRHGVGEAALFSMKPAAIVINTARGPVVDPAALFNALKTGAIAGAGLDVLEKEPPDANDPLLTLDNVIFTPHTAALTKECVIRMAVEAARCVLDVFSGRVPANVANPLVLKMDKWKHLAPCSQP